MTSAATRTVEVATVMLEARTKTTAIAMWKALVEMLAAMVTGTMVLVMTMMVAAVAMITMATMMMAAAAAVAADDHVGIIKIW